MSNPYEPNYSGQQPQQPANPAAPTQFMPLGGQQPQQPGYGAPQFGQQQPAFGAPPQQQGDYGQQQFGAPQQPGYDQQQPGYDQQPGFGQAPQFGQPPAQDASAWGQQQAPGYGGYPVAGTGYPAPAKAKRAGGAAGWFLRTAIGRVVIGLVIVGGVAAYHIATAHPAQRNGNTGSVSQAGSMQASDLKVGDCFDNPTADSNISSLTAIPCTQAHDSQVYAEPPVTESTYPGDSTLSSEASSVCGSDSEQASITSDAPESLKISALYAQDAQSFNSGNDYITCFVVSDSRDLKQSYVTTGN